MPNYMFLREKNIKPTKTYLVKTNMAEFMTILREYKLLGYDKGLIGAESFDEIEKNYPEMKPFKIINSVNDI